MFILRDKDAKFPPLYEHVERKMPTVTDKGWDKVGDFILRDKIDFMPQAGLQENFCKCESNLIFLAGAASMGKAQPYTAGVLTPSGYVQMGTLRVGDTICGINGTTQKVEAIYEQGERPTYGIMFADGGYTECDEEHLWEVTSRTANPRRTYGEPYVARWKDLMAIVDKGDSVAVPECGEVFLNGGGELPIRPYTMGALLGDGSFQKRCVVLCCKDKEIVEKVRRDGYVAECFPSHEYDYNIKDAGVRKAVIELGLLHKHAHEKFIPEPYKKASINDRYELLRGLLDTDGCAVKGINTIIFSTSSQRLAEDIQWIVRSLGGRCRISLNENISFTYRGEKKQGRPCYVCIINATNSRDFFHLERKKNNLTNGRKRKRRRVISYKYLGLKKSRCIKVSNPDQLYITDDFIVTHNTYSMMQKMLYGIDKVGFSGRFISVRLADSKKGTSLFRDAMELWGNYAGCEVTTGDSPTFAWPQWNSAIQMIHSNFNINNPGEWNDFKEHAKKNQASIIEVDEGTDMPFKMFAYWFSRNRDASGVSPTMVMSFNPEYGHWTTEFLILAGYIDPETFYIKPEMNGKQRFFYMMGDDVNEIIFGDSKEEVVARAGIHITEKDTAAGLKEADMVKSFSLFTGEAADNLKLVSATGGGSIANLHAVGRTQRSVLKGAYFGPLDNESANVTKQMILDMPSNPQDIDETMYGTMDVSGGNADSDDNPFIAWRGHTIVGIEFFRGDPKELVGWIDGMLQKYGIPRKNFAFDATGLGNYLKAYTAGWPITANKTAMQEYDEQGNQVVFEQYFNLRSQLMSKLEVAFKTGKISTTLDLTMRIPYGKKGETRRLIDVLFDEKETFRTLQKNKRIYYRSKDEYRAKFHASPNIIDTMYLRMVWDLDARPRKQESPDVDDDAYDGMFSNFEDATDFSQFWAQ